MGKFTKKPVYDGARYDATLGMGDEDDLLGILRFKCSANLSTSLANISSLIIQVALDEALDKVQK